MQHPSPMSKRRYKVCVCVLVSFLHTCLLLITSLIKLITQNHHTTQALRAIKHISIVSTHKEHGNKREMKRKTSIDSQTQLHSMRELGGVKYKSMRVQQSLGINLLDLLGAQASIEAWELSLCQEAHPSATPKSENVLGFLGFILGSPIHTRVPRMCPN